MKRTIAVLLAMCLVALSVACNQQPEPLSDEQMVQTTLHALLGAADDIVAKDATASFETVNTVLQQAVGASFSEKGLQTLYNQFPNLSLLPLVATKAYTLTVDNVVVETAGEGKLKAFALLELSRDSQSWHALLDADITINQDGKIDFFRISDDSEVVFMQMLHRARVVLGETTDAESILLKSPQKVLVDTLLR